MFLLSLRLVYDMYGRVIAWGLEAKNMSPMEGTIRCEWFKLFLEPSALRDPNTIDPRLPQLPVCLLPSFISHRAC